MSPALAGGFLTTAQPEKSPHHFVVTLVLESDFIKHIFLKIYKLNFSSFPNCQLYIWKQIRLLYQKDLKVEWLKFSRRFSFESQEAVQGWCAAHCGRNPGFCYFAAFLNTWLPPMVQSGCFTCYCHLCIPAIKNRQWEEGIVLLRGCCPVHCPEHIIPPHLTRLHLTRRLDNAVFNSLRSQQAMTHYLFW